MAAVELSQSSLTMSPEDPLVNFEVSRRSFQSHLNQSTRQTTNSREPSPGDGAGIQDGKIWGRLARTKRALNAIRLVTAVCAVAVPAFSDFCDSRCRTDLSVGETCP